MTTEATNLKYPQRERYYAHKLTRLLFKSCAAQSLGQDAVLLIIHIAHTEDAARYQGPVRFWNCQLNEVLGFRSPKSLTNARRKAIEAGWLHYHRKNDRADGNYWTCIPDAVSKFDDSPIEPVPSTECVPSTEQKAERESYALRNGKVTRNDLPPNPIPVPNPNPVSSSSSKNTSFDENFSLLCHDAAKTLISKNGDCSEGDWVNICRAVHVGLQLAGTREVADWIQSASSKDTLKAGYFTAIAIKLSKQDGEDYDAMKREAPKLPFDPAIIPKPVPKAKPIDRERIRTRLFQSNRAKWSKATNEELDAEIDLQIAAEARNPDLIPFASRARA